MNHQDCSAIKKAFCFVVSTFVYYFFKLPYSLFMQSVYTLCAVEEEGRLRMSTIDTPWPVFSFFKRLFLQYIFDAFTVLAYTLVPVLALVNLGLGVADESFRESFPTFVYLLTAAYYLPVVNALMKDFCAFVMLIVYKYVSWCGNTSSSKSGSLSQQVTDLLG